jgi:hypothetical protein
MMQQQQQQQQQQQHDLAASAQRAVSQAAALLRDQLQSLLHDPTDGGAAAQQSQQHQPQMGASPATAPDALAVLLAAHEQLRALALSSAVGAPGDEDEDGASPAAAAAARDAALAVLTQQLSGAIARLRGALDAAHALKKLPAPGVEPGEVVAYAHRLRYGFFPLGTTPDLWREPPAPQVPNMVASTLAQLALQRRGADAAAAAAAAEQQQQQEQQQRAALPSIPAGWKPGDPIPDEFLGAGGAGAAAAAAAKDGATAAGQPAAAAAAANQQQQGSGIASLLVNLNADLGEEVDYSEDDWSDD